MNGSGLEQLLRAISGVGGHPPDPPDQPDSLHALTGPAYAVSDPRLAPPPANPPQATGVAGSTDPLIALQHAYASWMKRTGRQQDPLAARLGQRGISQWGQPHDPVSLLTAARQITHGANAGQTAQTYDLGNGKKANVYFDPKGRRRVNVY